MSDPTSERANKVLQLLKNYSAAHPCANIKAKEQESFEKETNRIQEQQLAAASQGSSLSAGGLKCPTSPLIPRLFTSQSAQGPSANLRRLLRSAAKEIEIQNRLQQLEIWNNDAMQYLWSLLVQHADKEDGTISYSQYTQLTEEFSEWRESQPNQPVSPASNNNTSAPSLLSSIKDDPPVFCTTTLPQLNALLYLGCQRKKKQQRVVVKDFYALLLKQISVFKVETELIMRDEDNDNCIRLEELEYYVQDVVPALAVLNEVTEEFLPFYCCHVVRRIFWVLDPVSTGRIRIDKLLRSSLMDEWMDVQLALEDPPRNWFGYTISNSLHEKFLCLDLSGSGMLTREEMHMYKKGIPTVYDDGLPGDVSPLTSLFIDRVFEIMPLFKGQMDYSCFVDFVLAVEFLPQCPRPHIFWDIFNIHGDNLLTPMIVNLFFRSVHEKLVAAGVSPPPLEFVVPEIFDLIPTREPLKATKEEFCSNRQVGLVCGLMIDCLTFWTYENREQNMVHAAQQKEE